jgi:uncharacterized protein (DUF1810 family)
MDDPFNLQRFVEAQAPVYAAVLEELRQGRKRTHWMWFIFPQIAGLGSSPTSQFFAISGREEAAAYLRHPVLGARLRECVATVNGVHGRSALEIFGRPDDRKFQSCLTLFDAVADDRGPFQTALARFYGGEADPATMERL